jgi:demethylmenaquinone methyltransferase/2-methoxy-6-polyprenyl-1,4-benzoquinol methylase
VNPKGNAFEGFFGGANYRRLAVLFGMGPEFYRAAVAGIALGAGMKALDLGCGPGALSYALAGNADPLAEIHGVDISDDQLNYARAHAGPFACRLEFHHASMDELPFPDASFDLVVTSMALHETPPAVRRQAIAETARVLKHGGRFVLVDWSRPRFGLWGVFWCPLVCFGERNRDNWNNTYPALCRARGMRLVSDAYINSISRRQLFVREERPCVSE